MTPDDTRNSLQVETKYRTYPQRWGILACVMILNGFSYMLVITFGPVANLAAEFYNVSGDSIDLFSLIPMIVNMPSMIIAIFIVDRYGIQLSIRIGATCVTIGSLVRFFGNFPTYQKNIEPNTKFWLTLCGQIIIGCGHPFIITLSTKISQAWFSERERIWTTATIALSSALGAAIGSVISPLIVADKVENISYLNVYFPVFPVVGFILAWFVVTRPVPITPPSASAEQQMNKEFVTLKVCLTSLKSVLTNKTGLSIILLMGGGVGTFNTITTQLGQFMCSTGYSPANAGLAAGLMIICGIVGTVIIGVFSRRFNIRQSVAKVAFNFGCLSMIGSCLCLLETNLLPGIMVCLICFGFVGLGNFPLVLELAVEETYPTDPVFTEAFIHIMGQASSVLLILVGNVLHWDPIKRNPEIQTCRKDTNDDSGVVPWDYTPYYYFIMAMGSVSAVAFTCFVNPTLRRLQYEKNNKNDVEK